MAFVTYKYYRQMCIILKTRINKKENLLNKKKLWFSFKKEEEEIMVLLFYVETNGHLNAMWLLLILRV